MDKFIKLEKNYGNQALERLRNIYGSMYALPEYLSKNYTKIASIAFEEFLDDIESLNPQLMQWFDQDEGYNDEPDFEELNKTNKGRKIIAQYIENGWQSSLVGPPNDFGIYKFVLRLLDRAGAKVPNSYLSEDRKFSVANTLKDKNIRTAFIKEILKLSHETLLQFMPQEYMIRNSNKAIDEFKQIRRKKKISQ